ncbi:MAG: hypothetical protein KBG54_06620 [Oscillospiraceae bacterium]|jgi:hypothetical protein|nr:hypothetical protein [Oscillospiraceae bacterium]
MQEEICKNCRFYRQHYIKLGRQYREIHYGHCVHPRLKKREALQKACAQYQQKNNEAIADDSEAAAEE